MSEDGTKSSYRRNVLALMTGSAIAQALPIVASPILTRIYTPDDFGVAALFLAITAVLAAVVNGRYELAIGIPNSDDDAINVAALGVVIALLVAGLFLFLVLFFGENIALLANAEAMVPWLYLVPVAVLLTGLFNVLNYTNNRLGLFKDIAKANVYKSVASTATQLVLGWLVKGASGLILGGLVAQLVSNIKLYRNTRAHFNFQQISIQKMLLLAQRYKSFPKYSMWAGVFNTLANNILAFAMPIVFSISTLGLYSLSTRVLGAPAALISSAFSQVFLREATHERRTYGHAKNTFNKTVTRLTVIGAPIFIGVFFLAEPLFAIIFGSEWRTAGTYAAILAPLMFTRFVVSTVSMMNVVFEKNHIGLYWQIGLATISFGLIYAAHALNWSFIDYLRINTLALSAHYLVLLAIMFTYNHESN
jgi:O-antigen/teichoic acid export membrane protein